jgi:hypothetical protein
MNNPIIYGVEGWYFIEKNANTLYECMKCKKDLKVSAKNTKEVRQLLLAHVRLNHEFSG